MQSLSEFLDYGAQHYGEKIFTQIRDGESWRKISFRQLRDSAGALARGLAREGVKPGDLVAILSENRPEWGIAFFGILKAGATVVPLDKLSKQPDIESILKIAQPKVIFVSKHYLELVLETSEHPQVICLDENDSGAPILAKFIETGLTRPVGEPPASSIDDTAVIIFTSGTTGNPKGVMLSHGNFLSNVQSFTQIFPGHFFGKNFLSMLPLNHAYELTGGLFAPLMGGGTVTYLDSLKPSRLVEMTRETKTDIMLVVPAMLDMLRSSLMQQIRHSKKGMEKFKFAYAISLLLPSKEIRRWLFHEVHRAFGGSLRCFVAGGAPLAADVQDFFERLGFEVLQGYGLTETAPVLTVNPLHRARKNSVGKPLPGIEIAIKDVGDSPQRMKVGMEGEVVARGPNVMSGYYKNPSVTREVFEDGYFLTGDLGYFDKDGYLYISGRAKNLIVSSTGKKVFPEEIEEKLQTLPYAKEVCVLGRRQGLEESVVAVVVPDTERLTADSISSGEIRARIWDGIKRVNATMADFKRVKDLILWDEALPKTTTLKVKRRELERLIEEKKGL